MPSFRGRPRAPGWRLALGFGLALVLLAGCARPQAEAPGAPGPQPESPGYGGRLVVAIPSDPQGLDPHKTTAAPGIEITWNIYEQLVGVNARGELVPGLAERWEVSEDGTRYTFFLRKNVRFHNGQPFTAQDVAYTFRRMLDPETRHPKAGEFKAVTDVIVVDEHTVTVVLDRYQAPFLSNLAMYYAAIVPRDHGDLYNHPVGTGPFAFVEWRPNQHVRLKKFDGYWDSRYPYLDEVVFQIFDDPATALAGLKAGTVDAYPRMPVENAAEVDAAPDTFTVSGPSDVIQIMAINNARPPFSDRRVRQAISHAIDKRAIVQAVGFGRGTPVGSHMNPGSSYYVDTSGVLPHDPARARALLAEAGYPGGFEATLTLPEPFAFHRRTGEVVQAQLAQVGVRLTLQVVEWGIWLKDVYGGRKYDLTIIGHTGRLDPDTELVRYESTYVNNYVGYSNPDYDALLRQARESRSGTERRALYARLQEILAADVPAVFIQVPDIVVGLRSDVRGWEIFPIYVDDLKTVWRTGR